MESKFSPKLKTAAIKAKPKLDLSNTADPTLCGLSIDDYVHIYRERPLQAFLEDFERRMMSFKSDLVTQFENIIEV